MRTLLLFLICIPALAQISAPVFLTGCQTPGGTAFQESFGDFSAYACPSGAVGCNNYWVRKAGTADSIVASPSAAPGNTSCERSLFLNQPGSAAGYISNLGFLPLVPVTDAPVWGFYYYWHSDSLASNANEIIATLTNLPGTGTNTACEVYLKNVGTGSCPTSGRALRARNSNEGGATSFTANLCILADTWYNVATKCDLTATSSGSAASVTGDVSCAGTGADTSTCKRFTASSLTVTGIVAGDHNAVAATQHYLGNLYLNSAVGNTAGDSAIVDFSSGSSGDAVSTTNLAASTSKGNGAWTGSGTGFTISGAVSLPLAAPVVVAGASYPGSSTRSTVYDYSSNSNPAYRYTFKTNSASASYCFNWQTTLANNSGTFGSFFAIANVLGDDFSSFMFNNGQAYLETLTNPNGNPDVGSKYSYSINTPYKACEQFNVGGPHKLWIWDSSCSLLSYQEKAAVSGATSLPDHVSVARADAGGAVTGLTYFANAVVNYKGSPPTCH